MHAPTSLRPATSKSRKAFWLKQLHMWHWMSSAVSLIGLLLFAVTGFTLNHAADIEATPVVTEVAARVELPLAEAGRTENGEHTDIDALSEEEAEALLLRRLESLQEPV